MYEDLIRYDRLIDSAMRFVVKEALKEVCKSGLKGEHHFLLSFLTDVDGVVIPKTLKQRYPNEMTIVIQHQFESLKITEQEFSVVLSFDGKKEKISVPFLALTSFADPGVKFGLKFNLVDESMFLDEPVKEKKTSAPAEAKSDAKGKSKKDKSDDGNVVVLDAFRGKD